MIRSSRLEVANYATDAISDLKVAATATEVCSFTCLCNVLRLFVQNVACKAIQMTARLRTSHAKEVGEIHNEELTT